MKKIFVLIMFLLLISSQSFSATYYFSQSGTGDGLSPGSPDSIADHNSGSFSAGDIIYLLNTITTTVQPPSSGSGGTYITYRGDYSGSEATVDTASGAGFYVAQDYIKIQNITIDDTVTGGINCAAGTTYFWATGVTITDGASNGIKVSANNDNDSHHILIEDSTITGNGSNGIWLSWGDADVGEAGIIYSVDILNCIISNNSGYGVRMFSADNTNDKAYDILVSGNTIQNNAINGVLFIAMDNTSGENKISYNTISENSTANTLGGIHISRCANPIVEYNLVYSNHTNGIDGRGIYFDTDTTDFICRYNFVYDHTDNSTPPQQSADISVTAASNGVIHHNVCMDSDAGITVGSTSTGIKGYHNTICGTLDRGVSIQNSSDSSEVTLKNNIIIDSGTYGIYDDDGVNDPTIDYNCYYNNGTDLYQIASKGSGAVNADPVFRNSGIRDLQLQTSSPCINTGENLGATYDDALHPNSSWPDIVFTMDQDDYGEGWEIGAFGYLYSSPRISPTRPNTRPNTRSGWN